MVNQRTSVVMFDGAPTCRPALFAWRAALLAVCLLASAGCTEAGSSGTGATAERPNLIVLLTDDQRHDALGVAGNAIIQTPNMDRLAQEGAYFPNAYVTTSICATSRASILSGQYARRHGIWDFATGFAPEAFARTYPALLREAGYFTGFIGKYGLGGGLPAEEFDVWHGFGGQGSYHAIDAQGDSLHLTRLMGRQAVAFLEDAAQQEAPFALSVSFKAPHVEGLNAFVPDPAFDRLYADVTIPPPVDTAYARLPAFGFSENPREEGRARWRVRFGTDSLYQVNVKKYYRLVTGVDRALGEVRAALEREGLAESTVILLTSDNGFFLGEHGLAGKWYGHEASIRVPMILYDPRRPADEQGQTRGEMALNIDVAPTLLTLAGLPVPERMQGQDLGRLLQTPAPQGDAWRRDFFYEHLFGYDGRIPMTEGVVGPRLKYLRYLDPDPDAERLYNTEADPHELTNLADDPAYQDTLAAMRARWAELRETLE